jgi:hypothetical protein
MTRTRYTQLFAFGMILFKLYKHKSGRLHCICGICFILSKYGWDTAYTVTWALAFHSDMFHTYRNRLPESCLSHNKSRSGAAPNLSYLSSHVTRAIFPYMISGTSLRVPTASSGHCYNLKSSESMSRWQRGIKYISDQFPI